MPTPILSRKLALETVHAVAEAVERGFYLHEKETTNQRSAKEEAAKVLGLASNTFWTRLKSAEKNYGLIPENFIGRATSEVDIDDLENGLAVLNRHAPINSQYITKARANWTRICPVRKEPFGVAIVGDMHADNKGTDLAALKRDLNLLAASRVRAINIGDTLDNFHYTGKLASKQAQNRMSDEEGLAVAKWIIRDSGVKWDAHILGNHDAWAGLPYAHLFQEWSKAGGSRFYDWIVRMEYHWEGGSWSLLAAHDFKGHSIHNPLHGLFRRAKDDGTADAYAAGHRHNSADASFENGFRGKRYNYARVGSYKKWDSHAHRGGYDMQTEGAAAMFVIDPLADDMSSQCRVHPSIAEGLEILSMKRRNYGLE